MKKIFFLAGLPRSGSTLLGSIMSQNPDIHVSPTSPLMDILIRLGLICQDLHRDLTFDLDTQATNVGSAVAQAFYEHIPRPYVLDKYRGWPPNVLLAKRFVSPSPKIICPVRPIAEVITSYLKLIRKDPNNKLDKILARDRIQLNDRNRALRIWEQFLAAPYNGLLKGMKEHRECLHFLTYEDLVNKPDEVLEGIYTFLGVPAFDGHSYTRIVNSCAEVKDEALGLKDLHTIRPELSKTSDSPLQSLGPELVRYFSQFDLRL
jgi:sulfotransferase